MAESDLIRGNVDTVILKVLFEGDRYGYDLIKQINARGDGQWEIKQPTVYACLKRLEKQGFVSSYWDSSESDGGRRKYYSLTESGKEVFIKYKNEFERANALFGGIISGGDLFIQTSDDYSDVEDEGYSVPKRRSRGKRAPTDKKRSAVTERDTEQSDADSPVDQAEGAYSASENTQSSNDQPLNDEQSRYSYIQQDIFSLAQNELKSDEAFIDESNADRGVIINDDAPSARPALDPRSIIDRYYASETGESYSDVHGRSVYSERAAEKTATAPAPAVSKAVEQAQTKAVAQSKEYARPAPVANDLPARAAQTHTPQNADNAASPYGFEDNDESPARREYKTVLSDLVERFEVASPDVRRSDMPVDEQAAVAVGMRENVDDARFSKVAQAARELGNDVTIRNHNDSAKQYTHKYYYYSNRLMMMHYTVMCAAMFLIGFTLFFTFYSGLGMRMKYDYLLYIAAGLLPIAMALAAIIAFASNSDKKKRVNVNFRVSIIIRCVIMLQTAVVIYCLNLIWGMPVGFSAAYLPSLVIPLAYALFIPISEVIFMTLLQSERYAVE